MLRSYRVHLAAATLGSSQAVPHPRLSAFWNYRDRLAGVPFGAIETAWPECLLAL